MAELVDAQDLKSCVGQPTCQFDSGSRHKGLPFWKTFFLDPSTGSGTTQGVRYDIPFIFTKLPVQIN